MSEEQEVETRELQETIEELQEERREREQSERTAAWTRYVAVTTAVLAVFAAIGALQSGSLVNEAMILQLQAADKWNEYQADRQKDHLYRIEAYELLDRGVKPPAASRGEPSDGLSPHASPARAEPASEAGVSGAAAVPGKEKEEKLIWKELPPPARLRQYIRQVGKEARKERELREEAEGLEKHSEQRMHLHHQFARSVALIQVAISLSAVAALTRMKSVWGLSLLVGLGGIAFFVLGMAGLR